MARSVEIWQLLAPRIGLEAGKDVVVLVPLNDELLEVTGSFIPHLTRGIRFHSLGQSR